MVLDFKTKCLSICEKKKT